MIRKIIVGACLAAWCHPALAQTVCEELNNAVDSQLKRSASDFADGLTDNSAPSATVRELRNSNRLSLVRMNMDLLVQNKCPPRQQAVDPMTFLREAVDCKLAIQKGEKASPKCEMDDWTGVDFQSTGADR